MFSSITLPSILTLSNLISFANGALVTVNDWGSNPSNLIMNIYVPTKLAASPAVILALHGCSGTGQAYYQQTKYTSYADASGFILIYPSANKDSGCWDVASKKSLTHEGGGDTNGLANMLRYTIKKYNADPTKFFVTGSSSGGMMTNVMCAVYPDLIAAGSGYSGLAAGCLAGSPGSSPTSADQACAQGKVSKTGAQWASLVKGMYPGFNGTYPKLQVWHGTADNYVSYANLAEINKEWSTVMNQPFMKNVTNSVQSGYTEMVYGDGKQFISYSAAGVGHTVPVHESVDLKWFGIS